MVTLRERIEVGANPKPAMIAASSLFGLTVLAVAIASSSAGFARVAQLLLTLIVPAVIMVVFWLVTRERVRQHQSEIEAGLALEQAANAGLSGFLTSVSHELTPHPEPCNLRAEALAVAVAYREIGSRVEVAVPDMVVITDAVFLRQILHVLVDNAVRNGGERVAIWAGAQGGSVVVSVSDDGAGMPRDLEDRALQRTVDLGQIPGSTPAATGLDVARVLSDVMGAGISHRRDPNWTHFSFRLLADTPEEREASERLSLSAGVG